MPEHILTEQIFTPIVLPNDIIFWYQPKPKNNIVLVFHVTQKLSYESKIVLPEDYAKWVSFFYCSSCSIIAVLF